LKTPIALMCNQRKKTRSLRNKTEQSVYLLRASSFQLPFPPAKNYYITSPTQTKTSTAPKNIVKDLHIMRCPLRLFRHLDALLYMTDLRAQDRLFNI
jgi:hypothetical protein